MSNTTFTNQEIDLLNEFKNKLPDDWRIEFGTIKRSTFITFGHVDDFNNNCAVYHKFGKDNFLFCYTGAGGSFWEDGPGQNLQELLTNFREEIKEFNKDDQQEPQSALER